MSTVNISFDDKLWEAVGNFAKETRRTKSEIVRMALEQFLTTHYPNAPIYMHKRFMTAPKTQLASEGER